MTVLASVALACLAVPPSSDHITLRDVAAAFPGFEAAVPDQPVGLAPAPGAQRFFRLPELRRLAVRWNIRNEPSSELCFERPLAPLDPIRVHAAMERQLPAARIELVECSRGLVPDGEVEFPLSGLRPMRSEGFWSGSIRFGGVHRFAVWAKVKITMPTSRLVAAEDLKPGQVIEASQVRLEAGDEFPSGNAFLTTVAEAVGKSVVRPVRAGTALRTQWLEAPRDVVRGDTVQVEVWMGSTHLRLPAVAEASGSAGQSIPVRNIESKKRFWAKVAGKGQVSVGKEGL